MISDISAIPEKAPDKPVLHPISVDSGRQIAKENRSNNPDTARRFLGDGFEITDGQSDGMEQVRKQNLEQLAADFDKACNSGVFGLGIDADRAKRILKDLNADEFMEFDQIFATRFGARFAAPGEKWDVRRQLQSEHSEPWSWSRIQERDYRLMQNLVEAKVNEVPGQFRIDGRQLVKPGGGLSVGSITNLELPGGREYGVYVPKNADARAVVIVGLNGAGIGATKNTLAEENGILQYAENLGTIVVLPQSKPRQLQLSMGMSLTASTWNVPGYTNFPVENSTAYDDRNYLSDVISDLEKRSRTSKTVGLLGHSDGARFAQIYAARETDRVAAVVAIHGTTMAGDPALGDNMLPWNGGMGPVSVKVNAALSLGTNLAKSTPYLQPELWRAANHCSKNYDVQQNGDVTVMRYQNCLDGDVIVELNRSGNHSINDRLNDAPANELWDSYTRASNGNDVGEGMRWLKTQVLKSSNAAKPDGAT
jgi:poly(3-hydroxybutyrate) depolymerase